MATQALSTTINWPHKGQRVLVIESERLLGAGVASLLNHESDLQVVGALADDEAALVEQIKSYAPHVVVVDKATYLVKAARLLSLLSDYPELRVLVVSADNSQAQVFDKRQIIVANVADLVALIKGQRPAGEEES